MSKRFWLSTFMALMAAATLAAGFSPAQAQSNNPADYYADYQGSAYSQPGYGNMGAWCPMGPGYASSAYPAVSGYNTGSDTYKGAGYTRLRRSWRQGYGHSYRMGCGYWY